MSGLSSLLQKKVKKPTEQGPGSGRAVRNGGNLEDRHWKSRTEIREEGSSIELPR